MQGGLGGGMGEGPPGQKSPAGIADFPNTQSDRPLYELSLILAPPPLSLPKDLEEEKAPLRQLQRQWHRIKDELELPRGEESQKWFQQWEGEGDFGEWLRSIRRQDEKLINSLNQLLETIHKQITKTSDKNVNNKPSSPSTELSLAEKKPWTPSELELEIRNTLKALQSLADTIEATWEAF